MSASITWRVAAISTKHLSIDLPSTFIGEATKVFGAFPIQLNNDIHFHKIDTLALLNEDWEEIKRLLELHGSIVLEARY